MSKLKLVVSSCDRKLLNRFFDHLVGDYDIYLIWDGDPIEDLSDINATVIKFSEIADIVFKELGISKEDSDYIRYKTNTFHKCISYEYLINILNFDEFFFTDDDVIIQKQLSYNKTTLFKDSLLRNMMKKHGEALDPESVKRVGQKTFVPIFVGNFFIKFSDNSKQIYRNQLKRMIGIIPKYIDKFVPKIKYKDNLSISRQGKIFLLDSIFLQFFFHDFMATEEFIFGKDIYITGYARTRFDKAVIKSIVHYNVSDKENWLSQYFKYIQENNNVERT